MYTKKSKIEDASEMLGYLIISSETDFILIYPEECYKYVKGNFSIKGVYMVRKKNP